MWLFRRTIAFELEDIHNPRGKKKNIGTMASASWKKVFQGHTELDGNGLQYAIKNFKTIIPGRPLRGKRRLRKEVPVSFFENRKQSAPLLKEGRA
jgi:hypothetical protein